MLRKKVGDHVENEDVIAYIHANNEEKGKEAVKKLQEVYEIE